MEHVRGCAVEERGYGVAHQLGDAATENLGVVHESQVAGFRVLDAERLGLRSLTRVQRDIERRIRSIEVAAHVQRGNALLRGHRVEAAGIGFRGQRLGNRAGNVRIDLQKIGDRVLVFEARQAAQRRALRPPRFEVGPGQRAIEGGESGVDNRRVRRRHRRRWHLAPLNAVEYALPSSEGRAVGEIETRGGEIERTQD